jgi:TPR repeat protein
MVLSMMMSSLVASMRPRLTRLGCSTVTLPLLPALRSSRRLFARPEAWAKQLVRKRLWRLAGAATAALVVAASASFAALSLLPIDECDLLAASTVDDLRIGPGNHSTLLVTFYADKALAACQNAVEREPGNGRYWYQLSRLGTSVKDFEAATISSKLGYPAGYHSLGFIYQYGEGGVAVNMNEAKKYYEKAVSLGNWSSLLNLSAIAFSEGETRREFELETTYVRRGGIYTNDLAQFYLRNDLDFVHQDLNKYIELLKLGVHRGDGRAARALGFEYFTGRFIDKDLNYADELYEKGIQWRVDSIAAVNLARNYWFGNGVDRNLEKATYWSIFGAKFGNDTAINTLFELIESGEAKFMDGFGPPSSFDPVALVRILAERGDAKAQFTLGRRLEKSVNATESSASLTDAIYWYRKAAAKGNNDAKSALRRLNVSEAE